MAPKRRTPTGSASANPPEPRTLTTFASTVVVMGATAASRLFGFLRIAVVGAIFGASGQADVLNLVFNIPNNLRKLLAEGALSSAFVPALARANVEDPARGASRLLVRRLIGLQLVILVPVLVVSAVFAGPVTRAILDFRDPQQQILAADLFRWMIHYLLLISVAAVLMGTLNSVREFRVPALVPLWFSVSVIGSVLVWHETLGVFSMVVGVLVGGAGQVILQIPAFRGHGYSLVPLFRLRDPRFSDVMRRWLPVVSTASVFTINQQVALYFASGLVDGSGSAMTNALVFWQLPFGIFSASIVTVLFPEMSRQAASGDMKALSHTLTAGIRALVLLLIPSAIGLALVGEPMIAVALQRGAFDTVATRLAARVLVGYCLGLFSVGAFGFVQRFFYACGDYRTPLRVALLTLVLDVALSLWLKETRLGVAGLAVANGIAFTVGLLAFLPGIKRIVGYPDLRPIGISILRALLASGAAVVALILARRVLMGFGFAQWWLAGSSMRTLGFFFVEVVPAAAVLVGVYRLVGVRPRSIMRAPAEALPPTRTSPTGSA